MKTIWNKMNEPVWIINYFLFCHGAFNRASVGGCLFWSTNWINWFWHINSWPPVDFAWLKICLRNKWPPLLENQSASWVSESASNGATTAFLATSIRLSWSCQPPITDGKFTKLGLELCYLRVHVRAYTVYPLRDPSTAWFHTHLAASSRFETRSVQRIFFLNASYFATRVSSFLLIYNFTIFHTQIGQFSCKIYFTK